MLRLLNGEHGYKNGFGRCVWFLTGMPLQVFRSVYQIQEKNQYIMYAQLLSLFLLTGYNIAAPAPAPEVPGADGMCERPKVYVDSVVKLPKDGPHLVSGTRGDANVNGGMSCSRRIVSPDFAQILTSQELLASPRPIPFLLRIRFQLA